jgi:hypothetical protein
MGEGYWQLTAARTNANEGTFFPNIRAEKKFKNLLTSLGSSDT